LALFPWHPRAPSTFSDTPPQIRIWKVKRSQADIIRHMRWSSGLENHADLTAYWKFNDPDTDGGQFRQHLVRSRAGSRAAMAARSKAP
jgi:hypothetical protein